MFLKTFQFFYFLLVGFCLVIPLFPVEILPIVNIFSAFVPYVLILQLPFLLILIILKRKMWIIVCGFTIILSIPAFVSTYSLHTTQSRSGSDGHMSIMSYNASFFNVTRVFKKDYFDASYNHTVLKLRRWVLDKGADIVCFQEFFNDENSQIYNTVEVFMKRGYESYIFAKPKHDNGLKRGIATFSKYPILNAGLIGSSNNNYNAQIYTDVLIHLDTIRIVNVHLKSLAFIPKSKNPVKIGWELINEYKNASLERCKQMNRLISFINQSPYEVIVAGDFNETPYSNTYRKINRRLCNGHEIKGQGLGNTFSISGFLGVRIDHIFSSPYFSLASFHTFDDIHYSEHYPIMSTYSLN